MTLTIKTGDWAVFPHGECDGPLIVTSDGDMVTVALEHGMVNERGDYVEWATDGTPILDGEEYRIIATLPCPPLERIRQLEEALREVAIQAYQQAVASEAVAWRWKYKDSKDWINAEVRRPTQSQMKNFVVEPLFSAPPAPQPRVKPLVWDDPKPANNWLHIARSIFGEYYVSIDGGRHYAMLEANEKPHEFHLNQEPVGDVWAAKAIAEADYKHRILSALEGAPTPEATQ